MHKKINSMIKLVFLFSFGISYVFANTINLTLYENQPNNVFIENSIGKTVSLKPGSTLPDGWTILNH